MSSSISSAIASWPSGISPPLTVVTATDRGGIIAVTTTVALAIGLLIAFPTGIYIRLRLNSFQADHYFFLAAVLVYLLQSITVYVKLDNGLGKTMDLISASSWEYINKASYASDVLYVMAMFFSKCSTASIFLRLTPDRGHSVAVKSILAGLVAWVLMSTFVVAIRCHPSNPWIDTTEAICPNLYARWAVIGGLDVVSEVALFAMSIYLVYNIQMGIRSKIIVVAAFGARLFVIILAAMRLHFLRIQLSSLDPSFDAANTVVFTQFEIGYSLFASVIPVMKPFLASHEGPPQKPEYTGDGDNYKLSSLARIDRSMNNDEYEGIVRDGNYDGLGNDTKIGGPRNKLKLRPEHTSYQVKATRNKLDGDAGSMDSGDSQLMIIKKNVGYTVKYDDGEQSNSDRAGRRLSEHEK